jgi:hypothetical protein
MKEASGTLADLTVVLVCPGGRRALHRTLVALAAQTIAHRIEMIVVSPDDDYAVAERQLVARFQGFRAVKDSAIDNVDRAVARTLLEGQAPIVASIEDHAYPDPDWAEHVLAAYGEDTVAVGSAVINANPRASLSWSNQLIAYHQWSPATPEGDIAWLPLHNCSYRRAALEPFRATLAELFNREGDILIRLKSSGGPFRFAQRAFIRHLNPSRLGATARLRFDAGRLTAANRWRDENWGMLKRLSYAVLGPLIPIVRYRRMRREIFGNPAQTHVSERRHGLALLIGLVFDGAGQIAGFLSGPGGARDRLARFEMDRIMHLNPADHAAFQPVAAAGASDRGHA